MTDITTTPTEAEDPGRLERLAASIRPWLVALRGIPKVLTFVLAMSVVSGLALAWFWFVRHDAVIVRWMAVPWLLLAAAPQAGLWLLTASIRDLVTLPERLLALKSSLPTSSEKRARIDAIEVGEPPKKGILRRIWAAHSLHGELSKVLATRAILSRLTGRFALLIGPASLGLNALIILMCLIQVLWILR